MTKPAKIRAKATAMLAGLTLLLSGCFMSPGKFTSELVLMEGNAFTFSYEGEIIFLGLSNLAKMDAAAKSEAALNVECFDEETFEERECRPEEVEQQQADAASSAQESEQEAAQMASLMGGIDPSDPEAAEELRQLLLRQKGWDRVEVVGEGVFDVSYSATGTLGHDFMFPIIEGFPTTNPFVQIILRDDEVVRVNAPGFSSESSDNPMMGEMGGLAGLAGLAAMSEASEQGDGTNPFGDIPVMEGTFRIVTNGQIRANNTDEGPTPTPNGEILEWDVSARTKAAPTALIDLSR